MTTLRVDEHDLPVEGEVLHLDREGRTAYLLMATPSSTADDLAIMHRAHRFAVALADGARFDGMHIVETFVNPSTQNFYGHVVPGGAWVMGLKFDDAAWPGQLAQLGDGDTLNVVHKSGGDSMDLDPFGTAVREKREPLVRARRHEAAKASFSDTVRATVPQGTHEVIDADLVLMRQVISEALRPLLFQIQDLDSRVRRVTTGLGEPEDRDTVFGQAVRHPETATATEQLAAKRRKAADPFGVAVLEKREPLTRGQGHRYYRDRKHR